jgi:hypothetical protein
MAIVGRLVTLDDLGTRPSLDPILGALRSLPSRHVKGTARRCGKSGHWMAECPDRGRGGMSHLDALHARVKDAGGGSAGTARVLFELATELDAIELEHAESARFEKADDGEATTEPSSNVFEEFFLTDRDASPVQDFRQSRA